MMQTLASTASKEGLFPGLKTATFSLCLHMTEGQSKLSGVSSFEDTNPVGLAHYSDLIEP